MKEAVLALVLGCLLNMSTFGGQSYPVGSVVAIVIIGIWLKSAMDRHFEELKEQRRDGGGEAPEEK